MLREKEQSQTIKQFLTRPGEKLLFASRTHPLVLLPSVGTTIVLMLLLCGFVIFLQSFFSFSTFLLGGILFLIVLFFGTVIMKLVVDWYFQFYIITNFKVIEVCYRPFFSKEIAVIPLDQMRCVEVTSKTQGFLHTLYDFGDVIIQFDFLTHQDTFVLSEIPSPQKTSIVLSDRFNEIIVDKKDQESGIFPISSDYIRRNVSSRAYSEPDNSRNFLSKRTEDNLLN